MRMNSNRRPYKLFRDALDGTITCGPSPVPLSMMWGSRCHQPERNAHLCHRSTTDECVRFNAVVIEDCFKGDGQLWYKVRWAGETKAS
jgi:hypothetical protein